MFGYGAAPTMVGTTAFASGDVLVAVTDGLIERRDRDIDEGIDRVVDIVRAGIHESAQGFVDAIEANDRRPDERRHRVHRPQARKRSLTRR